MKKLLNFIALVLSTTLLVACGGGGGGSGSGGATGNNDIHPIAVKRTSYLNFKNNGQGKTNLPTYTHAMAYGDFFQNGTISLMTSPVTANSSNPADINKIGKIYFYKKINGAWIDKTSEILKDNSGCVWPRKAVSADFNGDSKPDIFLACTGFDADPFAGEKQVLLLSQPDGKYKRILLNITCYCHGASAADFSGTGYADLVITDTSSNFNQPMYLKNNRDGTFTPSANELPSSLSSKRIYSAEFIDINSDGSPDLFLAGIDVDSSGNNESVANLSAWTPKIYINHNGLFKTDYIALPLGPSNYVTLDILVENNVVSLLKTNYVDSNFLIKTFDVATRIEGAFQYIINNGIFWIIRDLTSGIVTIG